MTLKETLRLRTRKVQKQKKPSAYSVRVSFEITCIRYLDILVDANNVEEAEQKAIERMQFIPPQYLYYRAAYPYNRENIFGIQNIESKTIDNNYKITLSPGQKNILTKMKTRDLVPIYGGKFDLLFQGKYEESVPGTIIEALFRKGFIIPIELRDMTEEEREAQLALGSIEKYTKFVINYAQLKKFKISL